MISVISSIFDDIGSYMLMTYNLMMLLIIICLITATTQTQSLQTPLLKVVFTSASEAEFDQLATTLKNAAFGDFVSIQHQSCVENTTCPHFAVYDPFDHLLEQYSGNAIFDRYIEMIERFMDLNNYPLQVEGQNKIKLADEDLSVKIFQERRRLLEMEKSEDWEKASSFRKKATHHRKAHEKPHEKMPTHSKPKRLSHLHEETTGGQQQQTEAQKGPQSTEESTRPIKTQKIATRFQEVQHVWKWRFAFIAMTIGLLIGMKYLKREQQRIGDFQAHQVHQQQSQSLND